MRPVVVEFFLFMCPYVASFCPSAILAWDDCNNHISNVFD